MKRLLKFIDMAKIQRGELGKQSIGKSRGGITCKILALVDSLGNLIKFRFSAWSISRITVETKPLIEDVDFHKHY